MAELGIVRVSALSQQSISESHCGRQQDRRKEKTKRQPAAVRMSEFLRYFPIDFFEFPWGKVDFFAAVYYDKENRTFVRIGRFYMQQERGSACRLPCQTENPAKMLKVLFLKDNGGTEIGNESGREIKGPGCGRDTD